MRSQSAFWLMVFITVLAGFCPAKLGAQAAGGGAISGYVRGPGGIPVPGATVVLTNPQSGQRKETWTDEAGRYAFAGVAKGDYKLEVSLVGFRTNVREALPVADGKALKVDMALAIGKPEVAKASGGAGQAPPQGQRASSQTPGTRTRTGTNGEENGGAVRFADRSSAGATAQGEGAVDADLSASASNSLLLNGGTAITASTPGRGGFRMMEMFREFGDMPPGQFSPFGLGSGPGGGPGGGGPPPGGGGFGGGPGGMMGGGGNWARGRARVNRLRGNISERYTNSVFDARPYPLNTSGSPQIPSYSEQIGATIGGPLVIPKIYNGGNKTSFFVNYSLTRGKNPSDNFATVPSVLERSGDFSEAQTTAGTVPIIYNPASSFAGPRTAFTGNTIPSTQMDTAALGLLKYIPLPNLAGSVQNFHLQESLPTSSNQVMGRIGHQVSTKDSLNGMYSFSSSRSHSISNFPDLTSTSSSRGQSVTLTEMHTFSRRAINTLTVNFNRQRRSSLNAFADNQDIAGELGIEGISTNPLDWGLPATQFTNFTGLNDAIPSLSRNQTLRFLDVVLWNSGKHNIRMGGELRRVQVNSLTDPDARGTFSFTGYTTSDFTAAGLPVSGTGFDFADFLLGLPESTSVRYGASSNYLRSWVYAGFFQDDWRATAHLTFNYGLRYEYFTPFTEKYGHLSDLTFTPGFESAAVVTGQEPGGLPSSLLRGDANNLAPRIGIAYRPWSRRMLVLRGGYGIFYDGSVYSRIFPNMASQPPFAEASTLVTSASAELTLENGFPKLGTNTLSNTYVIDPNYRTPYAQTWNFLLEDEIFRNVILSAGYVGTKGTKLDLLLAPELSSGLAFRYETSGAASIYHGLQLGLRRQFHGGFSIFGNYTYSKAIDDAGSVGGAGGTVAQNYLDLQAERGLSSFDLRHRLQVNYMYELPFGEDRLWLQKGTMSRVFGGWQVSGITTIQSGSPFTATAEGNLSNRAGTAAISTLRADATGLAVSLPHSERSPQAFFNTGAFTSPATGQYGNAGRDTITGPGTVNFNMSLDKQVNFSKTHGVRGDFRIESDNVFNTPNFSGLYTVVNGEGFGRVNSVKAMRSVILSLRLRF